MFAWDNCTDAETAAGTSRVVWKQTGGEGLWASSPLPPNPTLLPHPFHRRSITQSAHSSWSDGSGGSRPAGACEKRAKWADAGRQAQPPAPFLLDSICEDDQTYQDTYCSVQVPDFGLLLEHFSTDEDGEAHDSTNQRVKPWKNHKQSYILSLRHPLKAMLMCQCQPGSARLCQNTPAKT